MTRKKAIKILMAEGLSRNQAQFMMSQKPEPRFPNLIQAYATLQAYRMVKTQEKEEKGEPIYYGNPADEMPVLQC